ncbi:Gfo/Idh/MocA family oxidoreductase, partial [Blastomonas sp.]|uniref:Gfo/Idh/MocA family oxidoreductase n=1 Tax=Blastomonas sp. TaxID=1909299 RepID=UPI003593D972
MSLTSTTSQPVLRTAIVGTGYIADFHARAIAKVAGVELVAVCDRNLSLADALATQWKVPSFASVEEMLANQKLDALHVLTPPDSHHAVAEQALRSGVHVFLEKPMCVSTAECDDLLAIAEQGGRTVGVNHSLLFEGAFARLRDHIRAGDLGPLDHITINCFIELALIRFGPFTNWMLREPQNALLEIGPHPISALMDLVGTLDEIEVKADRDLILPGGARVYPRWRIRTASGRTTADVNIDVGPGFQQRSIAVRGLAGTAWVDLDANTCVIDRKTPAGIDFDRRKRSVSQAAQIREQSGTTVKDYVLGKAKLSERGGPFSNSIQDSVAAFYAGLLGQSELDSRIRGAFGKTVIETCEQICTLASLKGPVTRPNVTATADLKPDVLVLGATGFIGRKLIQQLLEKGHTVRAAARGPSLELEELGSDRLEIMRADMRSPDDVRGMLAGIDHVFHLAATGSKTWDQFCESEIEPTRRLARACIEAGVKRLIYTSTIDSYYAGGGAG